MYKKSTVWLAVSRIEAFFKDFTLQAYQNQVLKSKPLPFVFWLKLVLFMTGEVTIGEGHTRLSGY